MRNRLVIRLAAIGLCVLASVGAGAATPEQPSPGAPPGMGPGPMRPGMGRPMGPPPGPHKDGPLDLLAKQPGRLSWGPLPVLRGQFALLGPARDTLHSPDPAERCRGAMVLGLLELPQARPSLVHMLGDSAREVRVQAAVALCLLYDQRGLPGAREALRAGPEWLRLYALHGLWRVSGRRARDIIREARPHLSPFLASGADQALAHPRQTIPGKPTKPAFPGVPARVPDDPWGPPADALISECDWWWHRGDYNQCIRALQTSLFFDPHNVEAYGNTGWLQWSMGRHGEAIGTYRRGIQANPLSWEAADEFANYYRMRKQFTPAAKYYALAASLGSPVLSRRQWGHVLEALGRKDEARAVWQGILRLDPNDPIARRQLDRLGAP